MSPCWSTVTVVAGPPEASPAPLLVIQVGPVGGGEVAIISHCSELAAVDEAHALGPAKLVVSGHTWVEGDCRSLEGESDCCAQLFDFGEDSVKVVLEVQHDVQPP